MTLKLVFGLLLVGAVISGCNKRTEGEPLDLGEVETAGGRPEDRFGKGFAEKFRADPNSEPSQPDEDDVPPVSMTTEPVPIG